MEDILDEPEIISQKDNLLFTIWTQTTETYRYILKNRPLKPVNSIINWYGVSVAIRLNLQSLIRHNRISILSIIIASVVGWLLSWLIVYIDAFLMSWTGKWIGGRANTNQFVKVSAWSLIPAICSVFPFAIQATLFDTSVPILDQNLTIIIFYYFVVAIKTGLSVWSIVIFVKGTAVLQDFTIRKAILNTVLALLIIAVPVITLLAFNFFSSGT